MLKFDFKNKINGLNKQISIGAVFYIIGFMLLPYDGIIGSMPSYYKPISIYFFGIYTVYYLFKHKYLLSKSDKWLIAFFCYSVLSSLITNICYLGNTKTYLSFVFTLICGIIVFFSTKFFLLEQCGNSSTHAKISYFSKLLCIAYVFPLIFGVFEILYLKNVFSLNIIVALKRFFGCIRLDRLSLTTTEASWTTFHMILSAGAYFYQFKDNKKLRYLFGFLMSAFFLIISYSLAGFLCVAVGFLCFLLYWFFKKDACDIKIKLLTLFLLVVIFFIVAFVFLKILKSLDESYYNRVAKMIECLLAGDFSSLISVDSSTFMRIGIPIINFNVFFDYPIFGVGGGSFEYLALDYISKLYPQVIGYEEIVYYFSIGTINTPMCLYTRILSEFGICGSILFFGAFFNCLKNIKFFRIKSNWFLLIWIFCVLSSALQFASFAFVPFWLICALLDGKFISEN